MKLGIASLVFLGAITLVVHFPPSWLTVRTSLFRLSAGLDDD